MRKDLVLSGIYATSADAVNGSVRTGITAAGTTIADAVALTTDASVVTTTAASTGAKLPPNEVGDYMYVHNLGANALLVYPNLAAENINALAPAAGFSVGAGKAAIFRRISTLLYTAMLGA